MEPKHVMNTNPTKYIFAGFLVILIFFGGLGAWSVYFPFQGAVIAPGTVKVSGEKKVVQHLEGGIIDEILVEEGDRVEKGQILIRLKSSRVLASVDLLQGRLWAKLAEYARLSAEATMKNQIQWPEELGETGGGLDKIRELKETEQEIFQSRISDLNGKISLYRSQIEQLRKRIDGAREELNAQDEIIANLEEELEATRPLLRDKYMGKSKILELQRMLAQTEGMKGSLKQSIAEYAQKIEEFKLRIVDLKNEYRETAVSSLGEIQDVIFEIREQIKPNLDAMERLEVKAPISGTIINLQVHSEESGVINPGMPLLDIVPENSALKIHAQIRPQDITRVRVGQETKVSLNAFERGKVPPLPGIVTYVSADLVVRQADYRTQQYYEAHVTVDKDVLTQNDAYLSPGMPVACYITTDVRSVISYLLDPLLENVDQAMRE